MIRQCLSAFFYLCFLSIILPGHAQKEEKPSQRGAPNPMQYGPVFEQTGFHNGGSYQFSGFQAVVNPYGGNLLVTQTDISLPGIGEFGLNFTRTHNSQRSYHPIDQFLFYNNGPLGHGWSGHYGFLVFNAVDRVWYSPSGGRELFYRHNPNITGNPDIDISGDGGEAWITENMMILTFNHPNFTLHTPNGLKITLESANETTIFKPTRITDVHGNYWDITYDTDSDSEYFYNLTGVVHHHPLVKTVKDNWNRTLTFNYDSNNPKRLSNIRLGSQTLASYEYQKVDGVSYLRRHKTGEQRTTTYTNDTSGVGRGVITAIQTPNNATMNFTYQDRDFFYESQLLPVDVYACTSYTHAGGTWSYTYPSLVNSAGTFVVELDGPNGYNAEYHYYSYSSNGLCNTDLWRVGQLVRQEETYNNTSRVLVNTYQPYRISDQLVIGLCTAEAAQIPMLSTQSETTNGMTWTTSYDYNSNNFNFPTKITSPGRTNDLLYTHRTTNSKYRLGLVRSDIKKFGSTQIEKTIMNYSGSSVVPNSIDFYRTNSQKITTSLNYYTTPKKAGAISSKSFGGYTETYDYQYGVLKSINYPSGTPDMSRVVNTDGTVSSESSGGISRSFSYDDDFRLTNITIPGESNIGISYNDSSRTVTKTQGSTWFRETYDTWGRLIEVEERIESGNDASTTYSYNSLGHKTGEVNPLGANYTMTYDVLGRMKSRIATNADDDVAFSYTHFSDGSIETETDYNGAITREVKRDAIGRMTRGSYNNHVVNYSYSGLTQTITIPDQSSRTVKFDLFGNKTEENHPETGVITYTYDNRGWHDGVNKSEGNIDYTLDSNGRIEEIRKSGSLVVDNTYNSTYGVLSRSVHDGVELDFGSFDSQGRARQLTITIPEALSGPRMVWPMGMVTTDQLNNQPLFNWDNISGAASYELEADIDGVVLRKLAMTSSQLNFSNLPGFSIMVDTTYRWRVRGLRSDGEIGPWSPWAEFLTGGPELEVSAAVLDITTPTGVNPADAVFTINNNGDGQLDYTLSENSAWLNVSPTSGSSTGEADLITISFDAASLPAGTYQSTISISSNGGDADIQVNLSIVNTPAICTTPDNLENTGMLGQNAPQQSFTIRNCGTGILNYNISDNAGWLSLSPSSGTSSGEEDTIQVNYNTSSLGEGTYQAVISINGREHEIPVTLNVVVEPLLGYDPQVINVQVIEGSNSTSQTLNLRNDGTGSLDFNISDDANWLILSIASGTINSGGNQNVNLSFNTNGLPDGSYTATISITSNGGDASIPVHLTVLPGPELAFNPTSLINQAPLGQNALSQSFEVWNSGSGTLPYSISDTVSWLSVSPSSGVADTTPDTINVNYNTSGLTSGIHNGEIRIQAGGQTYTLPVTLTITTTPALCVEPAQVSLSIAQGLNAPPQVLNVRNCGTGTLNYSLTETVSWLSINPTNGTSNGNTVNHNLTFNSASLSPGVYTTNITIDMTESLEFGSRETEKFTGTVVIPVSLTVNQTISIPDANFRNYLVANFDMDGDGGISPTEANAVTAIDCSNLGIADLTGLAAFTSLTWLDASNNLITDMQPIWDNTNLLTDSNCSHHIDISNNLLNTFEGQGYCWLHCMPIGFVNTSNQGGNAHPVYCRCYDTTCNQ